jgi:predicted SnoaL-like aldol condensation-catalyzing enzyme
MSIETNKELVRRLVASLNDGRLELLDDVVAPDYRQDNRSVGAGREGLKALFGRLRAAFPDLSVSVDQLVGEADAVVAVTRMRGT